MSLQLSKNATCVLTDADIYSRTQNAKMALNLYSNLPGSNIEGDRIMVITSANEPVMRPYSAGGEGGKIYGGVDGVVVDNDNDTIGLNDEVWNVLDSYTETSANFLTSADIADFATETYVNNQISDATQDFITSADIPEIPVVGFENNGVLDTDYDGIKITNDSVGNEHVNLKKGETWYNHGLLVPTSPGNDKYLTTTSAGHLSWENQPEIPSLDGYATETWVQNQGYITSVPSEYVTETEMSNYVTEQTADFITSADIPDVPEVKDLVAGNGIDITTTSADVTIAAKVDGSTITFNQNGEMQASGGSSYTAGNGIAINGSELSVRAGSGLKFSSSTSIDRKGTYSGIDPWNGEFHRIYVEPWMLVTEGNTQKLRFYCSEHELGYYIGYSGETSSLSTSAKVAIFKYNDDDDPAVYELEAESQLTAGKLVPRYSDATDAYSYVLGTAQGDPDNGIYLVEFTLNTAVDVNDDYPHYAFFLTDADTGTTQLSGEGINGLYGMDVPSSVATSMGDELIPPGEMSVDTTSDYDTSSKKPATCAAIASAIAQAPSGGAEYTEDDGEITLGESCDSSGVVITSQGPLYISKSGGLMGYGKITTNCLIKENGSLVDKVKVTFNNGLAEAVGTVIDRGTSPSNSYMIIAVPVFGVYNFTSSLNEIFMRITLTGAESGHTYTYDDSGYSEQVRKVEMYWI